MYTEALDCGIEPVTFWDSTVREIRDMINSRRDAYEREVKQQVQNAFVMAEAVASRIAFMFSENRDQSVIVQPWDFYPRLFSDEKERAARQAEEYEFEKYKEGRRKKAAEWNAQLQEVSDEIIT